LKQRFRRSWFSLSSGRLLECSDCDWRERRNVLQRSKLSLRVHRAGFARFRTGDYSGTHTLEGADALFGPKAQVETIGAAFRVTYRELCRISILLYSRSRPCL